MGVFNDKLTTPAEWHKMPQEYKDLFVKVMTIQSDSELGGPHLYVEKWILAAPTAEDQMMLAKTDLAVASRYAALCDDPALRKTVFSRISAEWHLTCDMLSLITGRAERLAENPLLARSIRLRTASSRARSRGRRNALAIAPPSFRAVSSSAWRSRAPS